MGSSDHYFSALTGTASISAYSSVSMPPLIYPNAQSNNSNSICRDEEKKMGTLVKEEFGRPNRENTMVIF